MAASSRRTRLRGTCSARSSRGGARPTCSCGTALGCTSTSVRTPSTRPRSATTPGSSWRTAERERGCSRAWWSTPRNGSTARGRRAGSTCSRTTPTRPATPTAATRTTWSVVKGTSLTTDQVVLVAAVGVAGRVGVVLEQVDPARRTLAVEPFLGVDHQALEHPLPRSVVRDELPDVVALGGRVLGVRADVEVQPRAVPQEHVGRAPPRDDLAEQVPRNLVRRELAAVVRRAGDPELGLEAKDPTVHQRGPGSRSSSSAPVSRR